MPVFPLPQRPRHSYSTGGRRFGAPRPGGRRHAACDLVVAHGTDVYAVASGIVVRGPYHFHHGSDAIEVQHDQFLVRYCEIRAVRGIRAGVRVSEGQVIARVQRMHRDSMLHFEMYRGTAAGSLTQRNNPPYQRRADLIDPTPYLDRWRLLSEAPPSSRRPADYACTGRGRSRMGWH